MFQSYLLMHSSYLLSEGCLCFAFHVSVPDLLTEGQQQQTAAFIVSMSCLLQKRLYINFNEHILCTN